MAFVTLIVPERILYAPRHKSICFHPSLLPRHRGASAINWTLIMGDASAGVTWFWPDKGIDTGPILLQRSEPIRDEDTVGSLYFNRLFPLGIETMVEAIELIKARTARQRPRRTKASRLTNRPAATSTPESISRGARAKSSTWCADAIRSRARMRRRATSGCGSTNRYWRIGAARARRHDRVDRYGRDASRVGGRHDGSAAGAIRVESQEGCAAGTRRRRPAPYLDTSCVTKAKRTCQEAGKPSGQIR